MTSSKLLLWAPLVMLLSPGLAAAQAPAIPVVEAAPAPIPVKERPGRMLDDLPQELLDRLDQQQLMELLRKREETKMQKEAMKHGQEPAAIPIVICSVLFICVFGMVVVPIYYRHRKDQEQQVTLRLMIEKGANIPVEFLTPRQPPTQSDLRRGVLLVATGLGLALLLRVVNVSAGAWAVGVVPFLIGAGYLVVWRLNARAAGDPQTPVV
jgi:hypothetical protein